MTRIQVCHAVHVQSKTDAEALVSLLQAQVVSVGCIVVLTLVGSETWRALVEALRAREPGVVRDICISRQGLPEVIDYMRGGFGTLSTK